MDIKELLFEIERREVVIVYKDSIENTPEFKTGFEKASFESLALIMGGHSAIKDYRFDESKLKNWCNENKILYIIDEIERVVKFKKSKR